MDSFIEIYPNVFSDEWCDKVINKYKNHNFLESNYSLILSDLDFELHKEFSIIFLEKVYPKYIEKYPILYRTTLGVINETKLHKYNANQPTVPECCENHGYTPHRCLAINLYLNTMHKGGEDVFPHQKISISPLKGGVAIFPACYTHPNKSNIPLKEDKFFIKSWIEFDKNKI
jgi:hypothetical protein